MSRSTRSVTVPWKAATPTVADAKVEKVRDGGRVVRKALVSPTRCTSPATGK